MAHSQMAIRQRGAPSRLWLRLAAFVARLRARHEERQALVKLLSEWDTGIASGSRL